MPNKIEPNYPYLEKRIPEGPGFIEKYGSLLLTVVTILGSGAALYTSFVTKIEIMQLKQQYNEQNIATLQSQVELMQKSLIDNDKQVTLKFRQLNDRVHDLDNSTSRSISDLYEKMNRADKK